MTRAALNKSPTIFSEEIFHARVEGIIIEGPLSEKEPYT